MWVLENSDILGHYTWKYTVSQIIYHYENYNTI